MMGSITRRLQTLEDHSREQATAQIRQAWDRLSDEQMVLVLTPLHFGREPTPEEVAAEKQCRGVMPESLIARAIGYSEALSQEEVSRRLKEVTDPVLGKRRSVIVRQLDSLGEGA